MAGACVLALLVALAAPPWARAQSLAAIPPLDSPVVDTTGTLDAAQKRQLEQQALALQQRKGSQLQVLLVPSTQPESIEQYTQRVFDQWKLGRKGVDDAVLLVVARDDRRARIQPGYGLEGAIPDITAGRIIQEYMAPKFRAGDYGGGLVDATAALVKLIDGEPLPEPIADNRGDGGSGGGDWLFALFAAFIAASFVRGVFGRTPAAVRGVLTGGAAGGVAWLLSSLLGLGGVAAVVGFLYGLVKLPAGRYARHGGWGGFGGGGWGGGGG
ncbi:MAG TPA: TPM domain-containing protein, partial [Luteimonas sp.]|nr:TPM domain-containing protein [Luteimonas sp.]